MLVHLWREDKVSEFPSYPCPGARLSPLCATPSLAQRISCTLHPGWGKLRQAGKEGAGEGSSAFLQAGGKKQVARIDLAVPKAIWEQATTAIRLLCAGWDLPRQDSRGKALLLVCKAAGERVLGLGLRFSRGGGAGLAARWILLLRPLGMGASCVAEQPEQETSLALGCPRS